MTANTSDKRTTTPSIGMQLPKAKDNKAKQAVRDIDYQQLLNAAHVPEDAGEHAEALRGILLRIPDGWGRWISCDRGWYPLLARSKRCCPPDSP